jgi:hypothetical protein
MAEEDVRSDEVRNAPKGDDTRKWLIRVGALLIAFLLGLLPMWWAKMSVDYDLQQARRELRREQLHNTLSSATVYARRGEYETARQSMSTFFTEAQVELDKADKSAYNAAERSQMPAMLNDRDDIITLLSRADPAAAERLSDLYVSYRSATGGTQP